ncbi:MAG: RluA family pseudouridine synthase [Solirubrobacterales bacterium]|nr:RluA family pseudouridine synthase [Solirubrobacterales bacterium]
MSTPSGQAEPFRTVFSDRHLAVIDKSADLVVHPAPSWSGETLVGLLREELAGGDDPDRPGIVHRLDRGTSGLMVVALEPETWQDLTRMIRERRIGRTYLALVDGCPRSRTGTIDAPIGRSPRQRHRMSVNGTPAREARTHFEVAEQTTRESLLRVRLETGRTHQIRVHMEAIGHPVLGDQIYGNRIRYGLERQFLHSTRLTFEHPRTGETLDLRSDLPPDLAGALELARQN